jgi:hypothetical protein
MKKSLLSLLVLASVLAAPVLANTKPTRFYGKVTAVDVSQKQLTVFNKKRQTESKFAWNDFTAFSENQKPIAPQKLTVGQYLMVDYQGEGNNQVASKVTLRALPGKKKAAQ